MKSNFFPFKELTAGEETFLNRTIARFVADGGETNIEFPETFTTDSAAFAMNYIGRVYRGMMTKEELISECQERIDAIGAKSFSNSDMESELAVYEFILAYFAEPTGTETARTWTQDTLCKTMLTSPTLAGEINISLTSGCRYRIHTDPDDRLFAHSPDFDTMELAKQAITKYEQENGRL